MSSLFCLKLISLVDHASGVDVEVKRLEMIIWRLFWNVVWGLKWNFFLCILWPDQRRFSSQVDFFTSLLLDYSLLIVRDIFYLALSLSFWRSISGHSFWRYRCLLQHASRVDEFANDDMNFDLNLKLIQTELWWKRDKLVNELKYRAYRQDFLSFKQPWSVWQIVETAFFLCFELRGCCIRDKDEARFSFFLITE